MHVRDACAHRLRKHTSYSEIQIFKQLLRHEWPLIVALSVARDNKRVAGLPGSGALRGDPPSKVARSFAPGRRGGGDVFHRVTGRLCDGVRERDRARRPREEHAKVSRQDARGLSSLLTPDASRAGGGGGVESNRVYIRSFTGGPGDSRVPLRISGEETLRGADVWL